MSKHLIDFIDISKSYDGSLVLDELNLYISPNFHHPILKLILKILLL